MTLFWTQLIKLENSGLTLFSSLFNSAHWHTEQNLWSGLVSSTVWDHNQDHCGNWDLMSNYDFSPGVTQSHSHFTVLGQHFTPACQANSFTGQDQTIFSLHEPLSLLLSTLSLGGWSSSAKDVLTCSSPSLCISPIPSFQFQSWPVQRLSSLRICSQWITHWKTTHWKINLSNDLLSTFTYWSKIDF